jgi:putative membrane protein
MSRADGRTGGLAFGYQNRHLIPSAARDLPIFSPLSAPRVFLAVVVLSALGASSVYAHDGQPLAPHDLWSAWSFEPVVVMCLAVSAALYFLGARNLWRSAGRDHGVRRWEVAAFTVGWLLLALALLSPLHRLGEVLFSAHMAQHELLMAFAAPLLVLGRPIVAFLWALPMSWRRALGGWSSAPPVRSSWALLTLPITAWTLHALAIWLWHAPVLYQATLNSDPVHTLQHVSFLGTGLLFWWALLRRHNGRLGRPAAVLYLFTTSVHTTILGALLTFSSRVWYPIYAPGTAAWGLTPLEDQQLAGLIMWVPAGLAYLIAALAVAASWLQEPRPAAVLSRSAGVSFLVLMIAVLAGSGCRESSAMTSAEAARVTGGNPVNGAGAIRAYGCAACHVVPGVPGAKGTVGPPLNGIVSRAYIAGVLTNSTDNLVRWIQHPQQIDPLTAMPDVGATEPVARDIASYLYTLK